MDFKSLCDQLEFNGLVPPRWVEYHDALYMFSSVGYKVAKAKTQFGNWPAQLRNSHIIIAKQSTPKGILLFVVAVFSFPKKERS
ncbi:MAG: hypothetical protein FWC74_02935 [Candidatus Bathyarchaeota archaeon]|jgi:hypothetical protein|nr:hypothetical protein [Candidatus Termitimicrobium sp.]